MCPETDENLGQVSRVNQEARPDELGLALHYLKALTSVLRGYTLFIPLGTLSHGAFIMVFLVSYTQFRRGNDVLVGVGRMLQPQFVCVAELALMVAMVCLLYLYDRALSRGDALHQEISDELEWLASTPPVAQEDFVVERTGAAGVAPSGRVFGRRPALTARIAIREFVTAGRMPFVAGPTGGLVYLGINLFLFALLFIAILLLG